MRYKFSDKEISEAYNAAPNKWATIARTLTALGRGTVSRQLARYWVSTLDESILNSNSVTADAQLTRELARGRNVSTENAVLRRQLNAALHETTILRDFREGIKGHVVNARPLHIGAYNPQGRGMTVEALFSDLQIGKLSSSYNTEIAILRVREYFRALVFKIQQHINSGYKIEKINFVILGDIIESDKKHPSSARGTDSGTPTQMVNAYKCLCEGLVQLADLRVPVHVVCVTGNHDHDGHGLFMTNPGKEHLSWMLFNCMQHFAQHFDITKHITFDIPHGCFATLDIYGKTVVYEHGVGVAVSPTAMEARRNQRAQQIGKHVSMFRMGDKHNITRFNNDSLIVNGAFFGADADGGEYSSILGYSSAPAQLVLFHVQRREGDPRSSIFDTFTIQLSHIQ